MRVIIYGAGAIGGALGGHLSLAGTDVVFIGRAGHVRCINENGLRFITPSGTHILKVRAVTSPDRIEFSHEDLVFLCVKSQDTADAMNDLHSAARDVPVFCFQNGIRNEETTSGYFPRVYGVMVRIGGEYIRDGEITVRRDPPGWVVLGRYPEGLDDLAERAAEMLTRAGFHVLLSPHVMRYKWGKLMTNLGNAVDAITNSYWNDLRPIMQAAQEEARGILSRAGITWISQEQLGTEWPVLNEKPRKSISTESQSSTWQSLARKQGSVETEYLNGEIVRLAHQYGMEAPVNAALVEITREMAEKHEPPGKYTPAELRKILGK